MFMSGPQWYTIKAAAEYLSIGEPTLYRWMRDGKITVRKIGDNTRFLQEDLDSCIQVIPSKKDVALVTKLCPACHSDQMCKGSYRGTGKLYFYPEKSKFWTLKDSNIPNTSYMCENCGHISFFGDTEKLKALKPKEDNDSDLD
jgi:excisionase family DNA binding protein